MIRRLIRKRLAQHRLAKDVERRKNSYPIQDFAKRRDAAKRGWQRKLARG